MKGYKIYQDYLLLNNTINKKYSGFINEYPLSFKTIEWYLRIYESVGTHELERIFYKRKNAFNRLSIKYIKKIFKFYSPLKNRALVNIPRLINIQSDTRIFLESKSIICEDFGKGYNIIDSFIGNSLLKSGFYDNLHNLPYNDNYDKAFWKNFEQHLIQLISSYSLFLKKLNFKIIITQDLHTDTGFLLSRIFKTLKIPTIEFAHAFTQDRHLVTILPVNGDYSIIWNNLLLKNILTVSNSIEKKKLINFDYPNSFQNNLILQKKHFLLLFPGLQARNFDERKNLYNKWIQLFDYVASFVESENLVIRCHPGDSSEQCKQVKVLYSDFISGNSLDYDLTNSYFVLGGATTVLVDAFQSEIPCVQITDFDPENLILPIKRYDLESFLLLKFKSVSALKFLFYNYQNSKFKFNKYFNFLSSRL